MKTKSSEYFEILNVLHDYNINPNTREIYIGGWPPSYEDEEIGVDHQMACEVIRNLTFLEGQSGNPILIHMCTVGGDVRYGMAIYDAIHESPCHITIRAHAHARSMSSIILQAADTRQIMPHCHYMIHDGSMFINDTVKGAKSYMAITEQDEEQMMKIYCEASGMTPGQIRNQLDKYQEWYLQAAEAVELGFADEVYERK